LDIYDSQNQNRNETQSQLNSEQEMQSLKPQSLRGSAPSADIETGQLAMRRSPAIDSSAAASSKPKGDDFKAANDDDAAAAAAPPCNGLGEAKKGVGRHVEIAV